VKRQCEKNILAYKYIYIYYMNILFKQNRYFTVTHHAPILNRMPLKALKEYKIRYTFPYKLQVLNSLLISKSMPRVCLF